MAASERVGLLFSLSILVFVVSLILVQNAHYNHAHGVSLPQEDEDEEIVVDVDLRRSLSAYEDDLDRIILPSWADSNLVPVNERPKNSSSKITPLFWHIPKSGGTTAKKIYECMGLALAVRLGASPRFGHDLDEEIVVFQPFPNDPVKFVNVDTTTKLGIERAAMMGLVPSNKADIIFTSDITFAVTKLFDQGHKARILALFRNPVDRSVSKFYYLQTAMWERTYQPEWANLSVMEWAEKYNDDENFMVKKMAMKGLRDPVDMTDLVIAKEIVRRYFIVGLMSDMEESFRRFNLVLGLNGVPSEQKEICMERYLGISGIMTDSVDSVTGQSMSAVAINSNPHPKVVEGSPEYSLLAERNALDMMLYDYITLLYAEQAILY